MNWNKVSARERIKRNGDETSKDGTMVIRSGSLGNRSLGAVDYLVNYEKETVLIVSSEKFNEIKRR